MSGHRSDASRRGARVSRDRDGGSYRQNALEQFKKPDAWKDWGKTKSEIEKDKLTQRIPNVDNFEFGDVQPQARQVGHRPLANATTGRTTSSGGFVLPPRPPEKQDRTNELQENISQLNVSDTESMNVNRNTSGTTSTTGEQSSGRSDLEKPAVEAKDEHPRVHTIGNDKEYPDWHQPYRHKKVKKELKKRERIEWRAPAVDSRARVEPQPKPQTSDHSVASFDLMTFVKPLSKRAKKKRMKELQVAQEKARELEQESSHNDCSESDAPVPSPFAASHIDSEAEATDESPCLLPAAALPGSVQHIPATLPPKPEHPLGLHPLGLPPKPEHPLGRPPSPTRFARSRPIVTTATPDGVVTTSFNIFTESLTSNSNGVQITVGTGDNGIALGFYEEREVIGGAVTVRTIKPIQKKIKNQTAGGNALPKEGSSSQAGRANNRFSKRKMERYLRGGAANASSRMPLKAANASSQMPRNAANASRQSLPIAGLMPRNAEEEEKKKRAEEEEKKRMEEEEEDLISFD